MDEALPLSFASLERSVRAYLAHPPTHSSSAPLSFASLPVVEEAYAPAALAATKKKKGACFFPSKYSVTRSSVFIYFSCLFLLGASSSSAAAAEEESVAAEQVQDPAAELYRVPQLASLGRAFKSGPEVSLTETEVFHRGPASSILVR